MIKSLKGLLFRWPFGQHLENVRVRNKQLFARAVNEGQLSASRGANSSAESIIQEVEISQDEFTRLLTQAIPEETAPAQPPVGNLRDQGSFLRIGNPFKKARDAVKKATSVVIGVVEDVVNVIVDTAEGVFKFVIDTAEKVLEFVEAVVETVVKGIKQFIEFLQFLFNLEDILATQRLIVQSINSAFESASALVASAKVHVSDFVDDIQEGLNEGTDSLIRALGVDPEAVDSGSSFDLPEAAEWLRAIALKKDKEPR